MQYIVPESIPELTYFPYIILFMTAAGVAVAFFNNKKLIGTWLVTMLILSIAGIYDFYLWEYDYGHNLSDKAPIKVPGMAYQPPLLGTKMLLNFKADSYPYWGGAVLGLSIVLSYVALIKSRFSHETEHDVIDTHRMSLKL